MVGFNGILDIGKEDLKMMRDKLVDGNKLLVDLKVVSATFLLVCFVYLKESICEIRKNVFYFTSKALLVLEIIKFLLFMYSNVVTSSNAEA